MAGSVDFWAKRNVFVLHVLDFFLVFVGEVGKEERNPHLTEGNRVFKQIDFLAAIDTGGATGIPKDGIACPERIL